ncbi:MAG: hypothetical protein E3J71_03885 [Candidatus Stahlbacteria bacterium]|nr:MAG: hypothetical protein E3J71_03885 [Candidatus Stahlbacteria bacterium]
MLKPRHLVFVIILLAGCARQGAIPNTDKFPPHLVSVTHINRNQLIVSFDEELDSTALLPSTFLITSPHDTADICFIARDPNDTRGFSLILLTSPLIDETYQISGLVVDSRGNGASIRSSFRASTRQDTTPVSILVSPLDPQTTFPYSIRFEFSEPLDTSRGMRILTAPPASEEALSGSWNRELTRYSVRVADTTLKGLPFYLVLLPGVSDFAGNRTTEGLAAFVYSDTGLVLRDIRGEVKTSEGRAAYSAIVLFKTPQDLFALTITDSSGAFIATLEEREETKIEAWFDRDGNGVYEEEASFSEATLPDSVPLITRPAPSPLRFDQLIPQTQ